MRKCSSCLTVIELVFVNDPIMLSFVILHQIITTSGVSVFVGSAYEIDLTMSSSAANRKLIGDLIREGFKLFKSTEKIKVWVSIISLIIYILCGDINLLNYYCSR